MGDMFDVSLHTFLWFGPATLLPPLLLAAWWFWWKQHRDHASRRDASVRATLFAEALATSPDGWFLWPLEMEEAQGGGADNPLQGGICSRRLAVLLSLFSGQSSTFGEVIAAFEPDDGVRLASLIHRLRDTGEGFSLAATLRPSEDYHIQRRRVELSGVRALTDDGKPVSDIIWARDVSLGEEDRQSLLVRLRSMSDEAARLRAILDTIPIPIWLRDDALNVIMANRSFLDAVGLNERNNSPADGDRELVSGEAVRELRAMASVARAAGEFRSGTWHTVINGQRRLIEISENPIASKLQMETCFHTVGFAQDITRLENLRQETEQHTSSHVSVLERLSTAVAIFGADTRLIFHNPSFAHLWKLDASWLAMTSPDYAEVLERQRLNRLLPEVADYPAFRERELSRFQSLINPFEDLLHRPDGRTLRRVLSPHPLGGLLATYEDVTDRLSVEARLRDFMRLHADFVETLSESVGIFDGNGHLSWANTAFFSLWQLDACCLETHPTVSHVMSLLPPQFREHPAWRILESYVNKIDGPNGEEVCLYDQSACYVTPLPNGGVVIRSPGRLPSVETETTAHCSQEYLAEATHDALLRARHLCEAFAGGCCGPLTNEQKGHVQTASDLLVLISVLQESVFDLRAVCAGHTPFHKSPLDIRKMFSDVLNIVQPVAYHKGVVLDVAHTQTHDFLEADGSCLRQVMLLLLGVLIQSSAAQQKISLVIKDGPIPSDASLARPVIITIHSDALPLPKSAYPFIHLAQESVYIQGGALSFFCQSIGEVMIQLLFSSVEPLPSCSNVHTHALPQE